jgi:hypothetical protein
MSYIPTQAGIFLDYFDNICGDIMEIAAVMWREL